MRYLSLISLAILLQIAAVSADVVHLQVITDQDKYLVGQTVHWTVYVWAEPGINRGIAYINFDLEDDTYETLNPVLKSGADFVDTQFGTPERFIDLKTGTWDPNTLHDIIAYQSPIYRKLDVGNIGDPNVFCKGSYTATVVGAHELKILDTRVDYWLEGSLKAIGFETIDPNSATFEVVSGPTICGDPGTVYLPADLDQNCYVNLLDFSILGKHWARDDCVDPTWCEGADISKDYFVDLFDVYLFSTQWLYCTDPVNAICDFYW
ncbi:hypothetical protein ACFL02_07135 [Planctomycetota bacterium]